MKQLANVIIFLLVLTIFPLTEAVVEGIQSSQEYYPTVRETGIHPLSGTVELGKEFTIEVLAYPRNPQYPELAEMNRFAKFTFTAAFDPTSLRFVSSSVPQISDYGIAIPGKMDTAQVEVKKEQGIITYTQEYIGFPVPLQSAQTVLAELTFVSLQTGSTDVILRDALVFSPGRGENALDNSRLGKMKLEIIPGSVCIPNCAEKTCGSDGCGESCGTCPVSSACTQGVCTAVADCRNKNCGLDGVGGSCGTCSEGRICSPGGICISPAAQELAAPVAGIEEGIDWTFWIIVAVFLIVIIMLVIFYFHTPKIPAG